MLALRPSKTTTSKGFSGLTGQSMAPPAGEGGGEDVAAPLPEAVLKGKDGKRGVRPYVFVGRAFLKRGGPWVLAAAVVAVASLVAWVQRKPPPLRSNGALPPHPPLSTLIAATPTLRSQARFCPWLALSWKVAGGQTSRLSPQDLRSASSLRRERRV